MAEQIISKSKEQIQHLQNVYEHANAAIEELEDQCSKVYSIATAGWSYVGEDAPVEQNIFSVIELLSRNTTPMNLLRELVAELAKSAGLSIEIGANHG